MRTKSPNGSSHVRLPRDLGAMLSAITLADSSLTAASILDPLIRPELERRYAALPAHVRKTVESRARKAAEKKQPA